MVSTVKKFQILFFFVLIIGTFSEADEKQNGKNKQGLPNLPNEQQKLPPADYSDNLGVAIKLGLETILKKENGQQQNVVFDDFEKWPTNPDEWVSVEKIKVASDFPYKWDFIFASYGSVAFRALRQTWNINKAFEDSLKSGDLIGQCSAGNSGCGFYHTSDGRFMLKAILGEEEFFFQQAEPFRLYYAHMMGIDDGKNEAKKKKKKNGRNSLLVKYLGFYRFMILQEGKLREDFNLPLIAMPNIFPENFPIDWKFDLKGSLDESRRVLDRNPMIKDMEFVGGEDGGVEVEGLFKNGIEFDGNDVEWLHNRLLSDFFALAAMGRYDYSLILSIHILNDDDPLPVADRKKGQFIVFCKFCTLNTGIEVDKLPQNGGQLQRVENRRLLVGLGIVDTLKPYSTLKSAITKTHATIYRRPRVVASPLEYAKRMFSKAKKTFFLRITPDNERLFKKMAPQTIANGGVGNENEKREMAAGTNKNKPRSKKKRIITANRGMHIFNSPVQVKVTA